MSWATGDIPIQSFNSCPRKQIAEFVFDLFSALANIVKVLAATGRALRWNLCGVAAIMANQAMLTAVISERNRAMNARDRLPATAAEQKPGITSTIEKDHGLPAGGKLQLDFLLESAGNGNFAMRLAEFLAHIDDFNPGGGLPRAGSVKAIGICPAER